MQTGFRFDPYTMEQLTLAQAQHYTVRLDPESREAVLAMAQKIPETQHGLFVLTVDKYDRDIKHVHLAPDNAIDVMNTLYRELGKTESNKQHGMHMAVDYPRSTPHIRELIRYGTTKENPDRKKSYGDLVYRQTYKSLAEDPPANYEGSFLLQTALGMKGRLTLPEQIKLERVAGYIPVGVRDAFAVDFTRTADDKLEVDGLSIAPNVLAKIINQPIRHHARTMELLRKDYTTLADKLEPLGAARTKAS